ncbi:bidirectional sugar transporter NEC1-like [Selaginella moellendorffii]|uniref:bidirectional sugar transporter NEC1-like n=1 Tax=Selaginella moellendorffii TaxID=88036 RepID=UPI000D1C86A8|nr:bidirectional sugar transporter NEC1-like [Selaginella moellendorffii]|eukprot:XP_024515661.1 bidirectional sugar transporter NEC1-like [Selaginella moellendorffii]
MPADKIFILGLVGNATAIAVYASPIPTFSIISRKKSTEMFSVVPYVLTLLTAALGLYYGMMKSGGGLLIVTVNCVGCVFELAYIIIFYKYASKASRRKIWKLLGVELFILSSLILITLFATRGKLRIIVIGSVASAIAIAMYASPLSVMRTVIRTKNVEAMPLTLTIFLLINGILWSGFAFFTKDIFIGIPSVAGSVCAVGQIVLYIVCKILRQKKEESSKPEGKQHIIDVKESSTEAIDLRIPPLRQQSLTGSAAFRTASGKVMDLLKELKEIPTGIPACRTASEKLFKEAPQYVELAK